MAVRNVPQTCTVRKRTTYPHPSKGIAYEKGNAILNLRACWRASFKTESGAGGRQCGAGSSEAVDLLRRRSQRVRALVIRNQDTTQRQPNIHAWSTDFQVDPVIIDASVTPMYCTQFPGTDCT